MLPGDHPPLASPPDFDSTEELAPLPSTRQEGQDQDQDQDQDQNQDQDQGKDRDQAGVTGVQGGQQAKATAAADQPRGAPPKPGQPRSLSPDAKPPAGSSTRSENSITLTIVDEDAANIRWVLGLHPPEHPSAAGGDRRGAASHTVSSGSDLSRSPKSVHLAIGAVICSMFAVVVALITISDGWLFAPMSAAANASSLTQTHLDASSSFFLIGLVFSFCSLISNALGLSLGTQSGVVVAYSFSLVALVSFLLAFGFFISVVGPIVDTEASVLVQQAIKTAAAYVLIAMLFSGADFLLSVSSDYFFYSGDEGGGGILFGGWGAPRHRHDDDAHAEDDHAAHSGASASPPNQAAHQSLEGEGDLLTTV